jgi:hypothetical protein
MTAHSRRAQRIVANYGWTLQKTMHMCINVSQAREAPLPRRDARPHMPRHAMRRPKLSGKRRVGAQ